MTEHWRICSTCKKPIGFQTTYWTCNVSTCNQKSTAFVFCSVACWDCHVPTFRHRHAWARENMSPPFEEQSKQAPSTGSSSAPKTLSRPAPPKRPEILVVASKLKAYIRSEAGMNTSHSALERLSDRLRKLCDRAIKQATAAGRKTVLPRDFPQP